MMLFLCSIFIFLCSIKLPAIFISIKYFSNKKVINNHFQETQSLLRSTNLVNVISPSLSPITDSCVEKGKSAGKKNNILSNSCPSCCPLLKSNIQNCTPSAVVVILDDKPITSISSTH